MLPSFIESIYLLTCDEFQNILMRKDVKNILKSMKIANAENLPI